MQRTDRVFSTTHTFRGASRRKKRKKGGGGARSYTLLPVALGLLGVLFFGMGLRTIFFPTLIDPTATLTFLRRFLSSEEEDDDDELDSSLLCSVKESEDSDSGPSGPNMSSSSLAVAVT